MITSRLRYLSLATLFLSVSALAGAQDLEGRLEGRIHRTDGTGMAGATVLVSPSDSAAVTDTDGSFGFALPPGTYAVTVTLGARALTIRGVIVSARETTTIEETVDWEGGFTASATVNAPSRGADSLLDAPVSLSLITHEEIQEQASHGQLPRLVATVPGAELTQSGVYDFNFNVRGFNSSLNRRVAVLIDGRDPSDPFFAAQEWAAVSFPLDDLLRIELVRGPSAALYGPNASSGILNLTTRSPEASRGGVARLTTGQLGSVNADVRWAGHLGRRWYAKAFGGMRRSGDFSVARTTSAEYSVLCTPGVTQDCLVREAAAPPRLRDIDIVFGGVRTDRTFSQGVVLAVEGGLSYVAGPIVQTGVGRVQLTDVNRPSARFNLKAPHLTVTVAYTGRIAPKQFGLSSGTYSTLSSHRVQFDGQADRTFQGDRLRLTGGGSLVTEHVDSFDEGRQAQSAVFEPVTAHRRAAFGQIEFRIVPRLKLIAAARGDFSTLHDPIASPRAAAVFGLAPNHSLRVTYNDAFQVPNYSEFFLMADAAPPVNLAGLNALCAPFGVDCGFGTTRVVAVGNEGLQLERTRTTEVGYRGVFGLRTLVTVDYHLTRARNFTTDLLPQLGTSLGRINPSFGPWRAPAGLPDQAAALIRALAPPILSNSFDGSNILVAASYTNTGRVDARGLDISVASPLRGGWDATVSYSWFDYDIHNPPAGLERILLPNTPEHTASAAVGYTAGRFDAGLSARWVDRFRWSVGPFQGDVLSYTTADLTANYRLTRAVSVGLNIANLFDNQHWESFGGDLLRRRALANLAYSW